MKRKLLLIMLIIFVSIFTAKTQTCAHSVELRDSYGDGWNGGTLTITVNGSAVLTNITIADGAGPEVHYFDAATGDDIDADYTAGSWSSENEYIVKDGGGSILGQSGQGGLTPVDILNMVGNCPACPPPTGQTETNITTTTADLGWTTGGATTWDIEWGPIDFVQGTGTTITGTNTNPYPLAGLTAGNLYDWYVRDDCGGDVSDWTGPHTFAAACDAITSFPYTENFDGTWVGSPAAPQCWTVINANSDAYLWSQGNIYITPTHSGTYAAHGMGNTDDYLITPQLDMTGVNTRIIWWDKVESATKINSYRVLVSTTTPEIASFTDDLGTYNCANTAWTEHLLDLSAYNGQTIYVAFYQFASAATNYGFGIDDVTIEEIQALPPDPATDPFPFDGLTTFNNPLLSWTAALTGEPATGYKVYLDATNPPSTEVYDGTNLEFQTTGLSAGTPYFWRVVPYNATGDATGTSVWSFTTVADGYLAESFENVSFPPVGWANLGLWSRSTSQNIVGVASAYKYTTLTQNLLRTPVVTITGTSTLDFFAATTATNINQRIQVQYSADGSVWTNIGAEISLPSMVWDYYQIDLSSLAGNNYYLAFATYSAVSASYGNVYLDHVIGPMITPLLPDAVTLTAPADAATNQISTPILSWTAAITGGIPTGYKIYLDETADPTTLYADVASSPYTVAPALNYSTTYYWKVVAYNGTGDGAASVIRSFTTMADPTLTPPFTEAFGTYPPTNWTEKTGLLAAPSTLTGTTSGWIADGFANVGSTGSSKLNIYGTTRKEWMITPPVNLGDGSIDYRLTFDLALTIYNGTGAPNTTGVDDKFAVIISTDNGVTWTSVNTLMLWDNAGSANIYNNISITGENIVIDLSSYTGIIKLGFYGESTVSNADNDLFVDNVTVEEIPTTPIFSVTPATKDFGTIYVGETSSAQTFTISNTGLGTLQITSVVLSGTNTDQFVLTDLNSYPADLTSGQSILVNVEFAPTSEGAKSANLTITDNQSKAIHDVPLSGTGFIPPQGSICSNPLPLTLPAVDVSGNTVTYFDDYSSADINPSSLYLNGDDVVYQFTVNSGTLTGTITTTGTYIGAFVLADCPNASTPPTPTIQKTSSGSSLAFLNDIAAGTYYLIISSYPAPQSIDYNINLSLTEHPVSATWTGDINNDWSNTGNWSGNTVPGFTTNVTIPVGLTNYPTLSATAKCDNLTIESSAIGDGSLMGQSFLTVNGTTTIERYTTAGTWHGISGPLDNDDFNSLYFGGNPEVWGLNYIESTNLYDYESDLATDLGDAKGWMVWVGGATPQTFNFTGDLRSSLTPVSLTNTGPDALHGYNFVGNPYPSAIDWDAASGWTKTNVDAGIWFWNGTNWSTYVTGSGGTNGGLQYVSLAQGFFVQVNAAQGSGTLGMTNAVQVHNNAPFMKAPASSPTDLIKLRLTDGELSDESIIRLDAEATEGYDGQFDMHKMFSWNEDHPQLYSTANNFMTVNVLPKETVMVPMDVRGLDGNEMTIALEEVTDFAQVYLSDEYTRNQTNLMEMPYTFIYDASQTDRFTIYFTVVGTTENQLENIRVYSFDQKIRVIIPMELNAHVEVVNMLGQTVRETDAHLGTRDINMDHGGYYLVNITGDNQRITRKVFIK